jgi:tetratricopeptide (TPR) repeat protein
MAFKFFTFFTRANPDDDGFQSNRPPGTLEHSIDWIRGQLREIERLTSILCVAVGLTIAFYALAVWLREYSHFLALLVLSMSGLVVVFGIVAGGALGFLFGIPRLPPRGERPAGAGAAAARVSSPYILSNSNLEEISDWLTKIIVGLGLIHLRAVPSYINGYRNWLVTGVEFTGVAEPIGFSWFLLVLSFSAAFIGFLFFYVQTRTRMTVLLQATELVRDHRPSEAQARTLWRRVDQFTSADRILRASEIVPAGPIAADTAIAAKMPNASDSADQWAAWAAGQARAGKLEDAAFGWRTAIERDSSNDPALREKYAEILFALNKDADALRYFEEARKLVGNRLEDLFRIRRRELLVSLYLPPPDGFRLALEAAEALEKDPASKADPWVKVWHVSALGQQHAWLTISGDTAVATALVPKIKKLIEELLVLVPKPEDPVRQFLRQLIDPTRFNGDPQENDLESLRKVQEIYGLVTKDA